MKLRPDQERVSSLLRETITLMCKNGLSFENQFCIEATIGITLDDKDVFVMSLNEVVGRDGLSADESPPEEESPTTQKRPAKRLRRKRTVSPKKTPIKKLSEDSWGEEEYEDFPSDSSPPAKRPTPDLDLNMSCEEEGKKVIVKQEHEAQPHSSLSFDDQPTGEAAGDDSLELEGSVDEQQPSVSNAQVKEELRHYPDDVRECDSLQLGLENELSVSQADKKSRSCEICEERLASACLLSSHMVKQHGKSKLKCHYEGCTKEYMQPSGLNQHLESHRVGPVSCSRCTMTFSSSKTCNEHIKHIHDKVAYMCPVCSKIYRWRSSLHAHVKSHLKSKK